MNAVEDEVVELVASVLARMAFRLLRQADPRNRFPVHLLLEEAHRYISEATSRYAIDASKIYERIAKEGRKYGLFLLVASQRPSELSKTVLSQCSNFVIHRIQNPDDLSQIRQMTPFISEAVLKRLPSLPKQHALVFGTSVTGITDAMVAGQRIDQEEVTQFALSAAVVIAHNAAFDRRFLERFCPLFSFKPWACSMSEIDWAAEGFEGTKLAYLAVGCGFFYDRHRAANDCLAAVEVLSRALPKSGVNALAHLLARARLPTWRIWAEGSPFEFKDQLKSRGYRWNGEENGRPRAWYIDVADEQREAELAFLKKEIYQRDVDLKPSRITAYERFSERV